MTRAAHEAKRAALQAALAAAGAVGSGTIGLHKSTSNLFRDRARGTAPRVALQNFDAVIDVDPAAGTVDAEGMTTYEALADATLAQGTLPCVVPQLKTITLGGALAGVGIEASAFRYGLVHETVDAFDVLTGTGRIVHCTRDNEHADLFFGFPNSYGTLGYAIEVSARTRPAKPFVALEHRRHRDAAAAFAELAWVCARRDPEHVDFVDGVAFAPDDFVITLGRFVDAAPYTSDYGYERIFWRSLRERERDFLAVRDHVWRWDTDWFWCSRQVGAQHAWVRRLLGRERLNSRTWQRVMHLNSRVGLTRAWRRLRGLHAESVIQDVDIPAPHAREFLDFLAREVGIWPVWLCPIVPQSDAARFTLYPMQPGQLHVNFGFWDVVVDREAHPPGFLNRAIEREVAALGGCKSLYSDSYYPREEFWALHDHDAYRALKARYDPAGVLPDLYDKCVRGGRA